ncbi:hypothetical protein LTS17_007452 [Exophiala oligosperma]
MLERSDFFTTPAGSDEGLSDGICQAADVFIATVHLTHILGFVLATFYSIRGLDVCLSLPAADLLPLFEKCSRDLDRWVTGHYEPLRRATASDSSLDATGALELAAYTIRIILYRAVLPKLELLRHPTKDLRHQASLIVNQVMTLLRNLTISRTSILWWPMPHVNLSTIGTFIVSMILSSTDDVDANDWTAALTSYQELLKAHSTGFPVTRYAAGQAELVPLDTSNDATSQSSP